MSRADEAYASQNQVRAMAAFFILMTMLLAYLLTAFWPVKSAVAPDSDWIPVVTLFGAWSFEIATEVRLIWLVIIAASIGSYVHTVTSFASYVGNRTLAKSWIWWYILRTPIGISLALVFYFVIRGGLFSSGAMGKDLSPFGVAALSGMVGMFAKQATDKLREIFDNLFRTAPGKGDDAREDKLSTNQLTIETISPSTVEKGTGETAVRIVGRGFLEGAMIFANGISRATVFKSQTELLATLDSGDVAAAGTIDITVRHPGPPASSSNTVRLVVSDSD